MKKMNYLFIHSIIIGGITLLNSFVFGQENKTCSDAEVYRNSNLNSSSLQSVITNIKKNDAGLTPTRDQDSVGYCFAFAGSDMLESWLKKNNQMKKDDHVSALGLGIQFSNNKFTEDATRAAKKIAYTQTRLSYSAEENAKEKTRISNYLPVLEKKLEETKINFINHHPNTSKIIEMSDQLKDPKVTNRDKNEIGDKMSQIMNSINDEAMSTPEYLKLQTEIADVSDQALVLEKFADGSQRYIAEETDQIIAAGGEVDAAINQSWPNICLESEISSRDEDIKNVYEKYNELLQDHAVIVPRNFSDTIAYIRVSQYDKNRNTCALYEYMNSIFKNNPFSSPKDMASFISKLDEKNNPIAVLADRACTKKSFSKKPIFEVQTSNKIDPENTNDSVLKLIDKQIEDGKVVSISYYADMLNTEKFKTQRTGMHASTIVGSLNVCGAPHYILRNSWGPEACENKLIQFEPKDASINAQIKNKTNDKYICRKKVRESFNEDNKSNSELVEIEKAKAKQMLECENKFKEDRLKVATPPFFCDKDGNFIVKKSYLKKGLTDATAITN